MAERPFDPEKIRVRTVNVVVDQVVTRIRYQEIDAEFETSISASTGTPARVRKEFGRLRN